MSTPLTLADRRRVFEQTLVEDGRALTQLAFCLVATGSVRKTSPPKRSPAPGADGRTGRSTTFFHIFARPS